jgi:hypothetical protein
MVRRRWKLIAGAAGLTLVVGCMNLSEHRWFERFRSRDACATPCCLEAAPCCNGDLMMGDGGPLLTQPGPGVMETPLGAPAPIPVPQGGPPTNGQRLVPQPQPTLQPVPFNPNQPPR